MNDTNGTSAPATADAPGAALAETIRAYFRDDRSRMTMMAARRFLVPERTVLDALVGEWPVVRLRDGVFRDLMEELTGLGTVRVFVRSRAAVIESVGTFGGYSESGPFFNVQTDTLDMHILHAEVADVYSVEKTGHDSSNATHSFQFFDHAGEAAFKVFLWEGFPDVPAHRIESFRVLTRRFASEPSAVVHEAAPRATSAPAPEPRAPAPEPEAPAPERAHIPVPEGVIPGSFSVAQGFIGEESSVPVEAPKSPGSARTKALRRATRGVLAVAVVLTVGWGAYSFVVPMFWQHYEHHLKLQDAPKYALTARNAPSDPLNVGLIGTENGLLRGLLEAGWSPADPATFYAGLRAAREVLMKRPYPKTTLSDMYLFGRRQDMLLEKPAGKSGGRHVVRLWKSDELGMGNHPLWIGVAALERAAAAGSPAGHGAAATRKVAADRDAERDALFDDLTRALRLTELFQVTGVGPIVSGQNADGDAFFTDGEVTVGTLSEKTFDRPPARLPSPWTVRLKDQLFNELRPILADSEG